MFSYDRISPRQFRYQLTKASVLFEVMVSAENQLLGYGIVFLRKNCPTGNLYAIAVNPAAQGRGVGRKLLTSLENSAKAKCLSRLSARTKVTNYPMQHLFDSQGWMRGKVLKNYYSDGEDGFYYERSLKP